MTRAISDKLNWTDPAGKYTFVETLGYSQDILAGPAPKTDDRLTLSDTDLTWNLDAKNILGGNYTYRKDDIKGGPTNTTSGWAVYYRRQITSPDAIALRYSGDSSKISGGPTTTPQEVTGTFEMKSGSSWLTRFEYRHDFANVPFYVDNSAVSITEKSQDLGLVSEVFTFGP